MAIDGLLVANHNTLDSALFIDVAVSDSLHADADLSDVADRQRRVHLFVQRLGPRQDHEAAPHACFIEPISGSICIGDKSLTRFPTYKRDIGLAFQNYVLFLRLSVLDNVVFGLKRRGVAPVERESVPRRYLSARVSRSLPTADQARRLVAIGSALHSPARRSSSRYF